MSNILKQADEIINNRSEEKERQYGPLGEGFERAAMIASGMSGRTWSADDMFIAMIALKFSRQSYNFKEDNLLDAVAYIGGWQNYIDEQRAAASKDEEVRLVPPSSYKSK
tara:strand:- start:602 stop:931 length:330 start_codon:yes stop_codon:yes gene_type:complete